MLRRSHGMKSRGRIPKGFRSNLVGVRWRFLKERVDDPLPMTNMSRRLMAAEHPRDDQIASEYELAHPETTRSFQSILQEHQHHLENNNLDIDVEAELNKVDATMEQEAERKPAPIAEDGSHDDKNYDSDVMMNSDDESDDRSRSPSPVIIWRPSARIQLATDLPKDLKSVFVRDEEHETDVRNKKWKGRRREKHTAKAPSESAKQRAAKYGSWAIPPKLWKAFSDGAYTTSDEQVTSPQMIERNEEDQKRMESLAESIPTMFISRAYKTFIRDQPDAGDGRFPSYLLTTDPFD